MGQPRRTFANTRPPTEDIPRPEVTLLPTGETKTTTRKKGNFRLPGGGEQKRGEFQQESVRKREGAHGGVWKILLCPSEGKNEVLSSEGGDIYISRRGRGRETELTQSRLTRRALDRGRRGGRKACRSDMTPA